MNFKALFLGSALLVPMAALADDTVSSPPPSAPSQLVADDADRFFPLSESAAVPSTFVRAHTTGQLATGSAFNVGQSVEIVPLKRLSIRATAEFSPDTGFTPSVQAKYQLLNQESAGVNLSGGIRYKQVGFTNNAEGEGEAFLAVGRSFGRFLASANAVAGINVMDTHEGDIEGHLSLGYQPMDRMMVGVNGRIKQEFKPAGEVIPGASTIELIAGPVVGYSFGFVDLSLQYGLYVPKGVVNARAGQIGVVGANFSF